MIDKYITVIEPYTDLHRVVWKFWLSRDGIVLDEWANEYRKTKRHKFIILNYEMDNWRRILTHRLAKAPKPEIPFDIAADAVDEYRKLIKFKEGEI